MPTDEYQVNLNGQWFYITEELLPQYMNLPNVVIYKITKEVFVSNLPKPSNPPQPSIASATDA